jgi:branched-chain amino acid transport system substrate-binding protein
MSGIRAIAAAALMAGTALPASAQELRIGYLTTLTGPFAGIGGHNEKGWKLGLAKEGWTKDGDKFGGVPARILTADDQAKPDVGLREVERMIKSERTQIIAGTMASNVMMAIAKVITDANVVLVGTNAGPAPLAGEQCNPLFVSASFMNDQNAEATGELVTKDNVKSVYLIAPNYQAGKDNVAGFQRTYKGKIAGQSLVKLGESDFQADFSKVRAAAPEAVFVFAPGAMGVSFMKQWESSGLGKTIKLYTLYTIDNSTLPAIGAAAIGSTHTSHWNPDHPDPRNQEFVKAYVAAHGQLPSLFAVQGYDAARAIAAALKKLNGKFDDPKLIARTMRGGLASVRGDLKYNVNGFLVQPYWKLEVVAGEGGKAIERGHEKVMERGDSFAEKCPKDRQL